jgi:branched-chain amino acid transport system substrate-binding protein
MIRRLVRLSAVALALALPPGMQLPAQSAETPYDINVILSLSGPGAFLGETQQKSLQVYESLVNKQGGIKGHPLRFVFYDDQTNPQIAVQQTDAILAKKPALVLGSTLVATCRAMAPLFAKGPVDYCLSPGIHPENGSYVFSASVNSEDLIKATIRYFRGRGWNRIARLTTTDGSGQDADATFPRVLNLPENKDMKVVAAEHFSPSDQTVTAQLAKIKTASPQALFIWAPGTPFATALRGIQEIALDVPVATSSANMIYGYMKQYANILPKDMYFQGVSYTADIARNPRALQVERAFRKAIQEKGIYPDFQSGIAWDAAAIGVDALRQLGTNATAEQVRTYIEGLRGYAGITGMYDFTDGSQRGVTVDDLVIVRWDQVKGAWLTVSEFGGKPLQADVSQSAR